MTLLDKLQELGASPGPWKVVVDDYGNEWWFGGSGSGQAVLYLKDDEYQTDDTALMVIGLQREYPDDDPSPATRLGNLKLASLSPFIVKLVAALNVEMSSQPHIDDNGACRACTVLKEIEEALDA